MGSDPVSEPVNLQVRRCLILPIPAKQYGMINPGGVHVPQKTVNARPTLDGTSILWCDALQPPGLPVRPCPSAWVRWNFGGVEMNVSVDDHGALLLESGG